QRKVQIATPWQRISGGQGPRGESQLAGADIDPGTPLPTDDGVLRDDDAIDGRVQGKKSDDVHAGKEIARSGHIIEKAHALDGGIRFRCWRNEMDLLALAAL